MEKRFLAVAVCRGENGKYLGFRVVDTKDRVARAVDANIQSILTVLKGGEAFYNLRLGEDGKVKVTGMTPARLPVIDLTKKPTEEGYCSDRQAKLVFEDTGQGNFVCYEWSGKRVVLTASTLDAYRGSLVNDTVYVKVTPSNAPNVAVSLQGNGDKVQAKSAHRTPEEREKLIEEAEKLRKAEKEKRGEDESGSLGVFRVIDSPNTIRSGGDFRTTDNLYTSQIIGVDGDMTLAQKYKTVYDDGSEVMVDLKFMKVASAICEYCGYYGSLYRAMEHKFTDKDEIVPTAGACPEYLIFNVKYCNSLTAPELVFILLHELSHVALQHALRGRGKNHDVYNIAADLIINKQLCEEYKVSPTGGVSKLSGEGQAEDKCGIAFPDGGLYSNAVDLTKDTAESIYEELIKTAKKKPSGGNGSKGESTGNNSGSSGGGGSSDGNTSGSGGDGEGEITEVDFRGQKISLPASLRDIAESARDASLDNSSLKDKLDEVARRAMVHYKQFGQGHSNLTRDIEKVLAPRIHWKKYLQKYLIEASQTFDTFSSPERRYLSRGMTLPGPRHTDPDTIKGLKVCIDTSRSISQEDLGIALGQVAQLLKKYKADAEVVYWDTEVASTGKFSDIASLYKHEAKGGGGTDVNCIFEYFNSKECKDKPKLILIFTDGYFGKVDMHLVNRLHCKKNIIWVINDDNLVDFKKHIDFGKVAVYKN